jgi:hypothetical protein
MAKVSKREEAFKLFDEGKKPRDSELVALGLSPKTVKKYQTLWRKQKTPTEQAPCGEVEAPVAPFAAGEVPVESIPDGNLFELRGLIYRKERVVYSGEVIATRLVGTAYTTILTPKGSAEFKPGVMVVAK